MWNAESITLSSNKKVPIGFTSKTNKQTNKHVLNTASKSMCSLLLCFFLLLFSESMTTWIMGDSIVANAGKNGDQLPGGCRTIGSSLSGARCADLNSQLRRLIAQKPGSDDTCSPHRDQ